MPVHRHTTGWEGREPSDAHTWVITGTANAATVRQSELLPPFAGQMRLCVLQCAM